MRAKDLYQKLKALLSEDSRIAEYEISTEGCDCYGDVGSVEVEHHDHTVSLLRS